MTTLTRAIADLPRIPLAVFLLVVLLVGGTRVAGTVGALVPADPGPPDAEALAPGEGLGLEHEIPAGLAGVSGAVASTVADDELARIRANVTFWGDRYRAQATDFVSATRFAGASMDLARATGDVSGYVAAEAAIDAALAVDPDYGPARGLHGTVLIALHRFPDARDAAVTFLRDVPNDPSALATLGDATLELGDLPAAAGAYERLALVADGPATRVRTARLAFIRGRTDDAVEAARAAVTAARDDGAVGPSLAWYEAQLGDVLLATGDRAGGAEAYDRALSADPAFPLALAGRSRIAAAEGRLDPAIDDLDRALAVIPLPELLARRADLLERRAELGDDRQAANDRATILAIADLSGEAAGVYDRTLALYLASTGIDPARAVTLARDELRVRQDVYGYDALGWALLADGRAAEADTAMAQALAVGTRDARILYHAGMVAAAVGDAPRAHRLLMDALDLDPTFDPVGVERARSTLADLP